MSSYVKLKNTISIDEIKSTRKQKKILEFKKKHLSDDSIIDWYVNVYELDDKKTAILLCQLENLNWSYKLIRNYIIFISIISFILISTALAFLADKELGNIFAIIGAIPLTIYALDWSKVSFSNLYFTMTLRKTVENLYNQILDCKKLKIEDCMDLQNDIFESRKSSLMVPNYFYYLFKKRYEGVSNSTKEFRIKQLKKQCPGLFLSRRDIPT